jgi:uncharacterized surface protein with fasciclin (FAS1) repeats
MRNGFSLAIVAVVCAAASVTVTAQEKTVMVGGAPMYPSKNIVENAMQSKEHTMLVAAVKAAGLVETLQGKGPFTVFAPVNAAFEKLPAGTVDTLLKPENKKMLTDVLTYHVVAGRWDAAQLMAAAKKMNGRVELKTVQGAALWAIVDGNTVWLQDGKGVKARVTTADVFQSNGVIHVIDTVVMAK